MITLCYQEADSILILLFCCLQGWLSSTDLPAVAVLVMLETTLYSNVAMYTARAAALMPARDTADYQRGPAVQAAGQLLLLLVPAGVPNSASTACVAGDVPAASTMFYPIVARRSDCSACCTDCTQSCREQVHVHQKGYRYSDNQDVLNNGTCRLTWHV
jgi:hypothetical protein